MLFRSFALCALLSIAAPLAVAQDGNNRRVLENFDVTPRTSTADKTVATAPADRSTDKSSSESRSTKATKESKATKKKPAVIKTVVSAPKAPPKGEGYQPTDTANTDEAPAPPPPPKIYSELRTSITDDGKVMLTSDTIIVKPEVKLIPTALSPTESTGNRELDEIIQKSARNNKVDPRLVLEVIRQESGFRVQAVSNKGARGLMQLIPSTAARFGVNRIHDPAENIEGGTRYLRFLLDLFDGNVELALAGYNAGENAVIRNNFQIPRYRETRDYVRSITARYRSKYHQVAVAKTETTVVHKQPLATFAAENGRVILSNNY